MWAGKWHLSRSKEGLCREAQRPARVLEANLTIGGLQMENIIENNAVVTQKLNIKRELLYNLEIPFLSLYPEDLKLGPWREWSHVYCAAHNSWHGNSTIGTGWSDMPNWAKPHSEVAFSLTGKEIMPRGWTSGTLYPVRYHSYRRQTEYDFTYIIPLKMCSYRTRVQWWLQSWGQGRGPTDQSTKSGQVGWMSSTGLLGMLH